MRLLVPVTVSAICLNNKMVLVLFPTCLQFIFLKLQYIVVIKKILQILELITQCSNSARNIKIETCTHCISHGPHMGTALLTAI